MTGTALAYGMKGGVEQLSGGGMRAVDDEETNVMKKSGQTGV